MEGKLRFQKKGNSNKSIVGSNPRMRQFGAQEVNSMETTTLETKEEIKTVGKTVGKTVKIVDTPKGCRATISTYVKQKGREEITFLNTTGDDVTIQFSVDGIFYHPPILKLKNAIPETLIVQDYAPPGFHPYSVYCHGRGEFAEGGSMPIIIVDPKPV